MTRSDDLRLPRPSSAIQRRVKAEEAVDRLTAENERLREALRIIATAAERVPDWRAMVEVARAALDGTGTEPGPQ